MGALFVLAGFLACLGIVYPVVSLMLARLAGDTRPAWIVWGEW